MNTTQSTGEQLKAAGQAKALKHAGSAWLANILSDFRDYVERRYCHGHDDVNVDAFRATVSPWREPVNPNAWGALPRAAVKAGYITPTDRIVKATRPQAQARVVKVWGINPAAL